LTKKRNPFARGDRHRAFVRTYFSRKNFKKSRLTGAIRANQAVTIAWNKFDIHVFE